MAESFDTEVVIVGGGPAGAALAIRLAAAGIESVLFERTSAPRWRACGVFSSPLTRRRLLDLGLAHELVADLSRPISALDLQTTSGTRCRLEYAATGHACGFDRVRLDAALLDRARAAGADVRAGTVVTSVAPAADRRTPARLLVSPTDPAGRAETQAWRARLVVGADGPRSLVARAAGVAQDRKPLAKAGITFHRADPDAAPDGRPMAGRFLLGRGWYAGIAPVPRGRVNVGIVVPAETLGGDVGDLIRTTLAQFPLPLDRWQSEPMTDRVTVALPLAHGVRRAAGPGFVVVGDAAGFIDPLTGEGLHRALVSSELAADAIARSSRGDPRALEDYDRRLRARFRNKDVVSWLLQAFLAQPALLDYALARLSRRAQQREVFRLVLTDQIPASRALGPRFLLRTLAP